MSNEELLERVRELVREVTVARYEGSLHNKLARAHGYADGYMRALLDAGLVDRKALLATVAGGRREALETDPDALVAA